MGKIEYRGRKSINKKKVKRQEEAIARKNNKKKEITTCIGYRGEEW